MTSGASNGSLALEAAIVVAGLGGLVSIAAGCFRLYRRTLGRRRARYRQLAQLGTMAALSFFESVIGESPAMRQTFSFGEDDKENIEGGADARFIECIFVDRDFYLQTICNEDEAVLSFSITTRSKRFKPEFLYPPKPGFRDRWRLRRAERSYQPYFQLSLGHTRFADLGLEGQPQRRAALGAHDYGYTERYYLANPGHYQTFAFTASNAGYVAPLGSISEVADAIPGLGWTDRFAEEDIGELEAVGKFRRETAITTYTIMLEFQNFPAKFGPNHNLVRTLP